MGSVSCFTYFTYGSVLTYIYSGSFSAIDRRWFLESREYLQGLDWLLEYLQDIRRCK